MLTYGFWKITLGVIATLGLYSVLYRENKFYRLVEHVFLGLAAGWMIVVLWAETLKPEWWDSMVGRLPEEGDPGRLGNWFWAILLPIGLMGYFVFNKRHAWISRVPIGIILGLWSGQQIQVWWTRYGPQIHNSILPVWPTTWSPLTVPDAAGLPPEEAAAIAANIYASQAIGNLIHVFTVLAVLSYFLFSFDVKSKFVLGVSRWGRYLLMIGFGAIFGSTVMMRFTLLIDRMYFIWIEWLQNSILRGGGTPGA
jgi:hypothetical protein